MADAETDTPRRGPHGAGAVGGVAAAVLLVLLVAVWAASAGPDDPLRGQGLSPDRIATETPPTSPPTVTPGDAPPGERERDGGTDVLATAIGLLVLALAVSLALAALWLGGSALWRLRHLRRRRRVAADHPPTLDEARAVASAMAADAAEQEDLLSTGTPRNAVVACWHRFEVQAERAGYPRQRWETSAEFTLRLLDLVEADASAVARLAELYREARFSEHDLDETDRRAALELVRTIHRDLHTLLGRGRR